MNYFKGWQKLFQHTLFRSSKCKPKKHLFTSALPDFKYQFQLSGLKNASEITGQVELLIKKQDVSHRLLKATISAIRWCTKEVERASGNVMRSKWMQFPVTISTKITIHDNPYESERSWAPYVCVCVCAVEALLYAYFHLL